MTPSEISQTLLQTPAPRDQRVADLAARLVFPRVDRVLIFILSFGLIPAVVGFVCGAVFGIFGTPSLPTSITVGLSLAYVPTWLGLTIWYVRRRHKQFVDVAQYGVLRHVERTRAPSPPISASSALHRASGEERTHLATSVGGYEGLLKSVGFKGVLVKPGNRRALALHVNGITASRVKWKTNLPTATALNE
jgi:hypothetical protein